MMPSTYEYNKWIDMSAIGFAFREEGSVAEVDDETLTDSSNCRADHLLLAIDVSQTFYRSFPVGFHWLLAIFYGLLLLTVYAMN